MPFLGDAPNTTTAVEFVSTGTKAAPAPVYLRHEPYAAPVVSAAPVKARRVAQPVPGRALRSLLWANMDSDVCTWGPAPTADEPIYQIMLGQIFHAPFMTSRHVAGALRYVFGVTARGEPRWNPQGTCCYVHVTRDDYIDLVCAAHRTLLFTETGIHWVPMGDAAGRVELRGLLAQLRMQSPALPKYPITVEEAKPPRDRRLRGPWRAADALVKNQVAFCPYKDFE